MTHLYDQGYLQIGEITGFHGLRGDMKLRTPDQQLPNWLDTLRQVIFVVGNQAPHTFHIDRAVWRSPAVILKVKELPDRTACEPWKNAIVLAKQADLPALGQDEFLIQDLEGLTVIDLTSKAPLGTVKGVYFSGRQDFLEIDFLNTSAKPQLIPFNSQFFHEVDLEAKTIELDLPDGLVDC